MKTDLMPGDELLSHEVSQLEVVRAYQQLLALHPIEGRVLAFARKAMGLKQETLGAMIGVAEETISRYETEALSAPVLYVIALRALLLESSSWPGYRRTEPRHRP